MTPFLIPIELELLYFGLWGISQAFSFVLIFRHYSSSGRYLGERTELGLGFLLARTSAVMVNITCALILFPVCRVTLTSLRHWKLAQLLPVDQHIRAHRWIGMSLFLWSSIHMGAHYVNFWHLTQWSISSRLKDALQWAFLSPTGSTGHFLFLLLIIIAFSARRKVRTRRFDTFISLHHLYILFLIFCMIHGTFCFIAKALRATCSYHSTFHLYILPGLVLYVTERMYRYIRYRRTVQVQSVILHPSQVIELRMNAPWIRYEPGQWIYLAFPGISAVQMHPFTITSAPQDDFVSVHIRIVGDWTGRVARALTSKGISASGDSIGEIHHIRVDGPYGAPCTAMLDYRCIYLGGAGIGITPFASLLRNLWWKVRQGEIMTLQHVYLTWVCRDIESFEWFSELLFSLDDPAFRSKCTIHIHITRGSLERVQGRIDDLTRGNRSIASKIPTLHFHTSRPNFSRIVQRLGQLHPAEDVGVFACGPRTLTRSLRHAAYHYTDLSHGGTRFYFHKGNDFSNRV
ncbi:ferric reductase NAD binding domain-containing protein [Piptocephalis cylindrospora]|uniref:Ferric reductase NAD binding domain-containing protein n=1 Tax=Piptocephalis cylindrospora TaxID=1907219 RepID=A0A4P9Y401_9FUNG|nr:ferric reductase NAD binding domain-containing protein [Piptocephalis cylindrospora]|eukprot:RKP13444.1 ferric reductase NAD binding domain-containing protein [Piptocephalis cylindrospora]